jgi:hypothetical protein
MAGWMAGWMDGWMDYDGVWMDEYGYSFHIYRLSFYSSTNIKW